MQKEKAPLHKDRGSVALVGFSSDYRAPKGAERRLGIVAGAVLASYAKYWIVPSGITPTLAPPG